MFPHLSEVDYRDPLWTFSIIGVGAYGDERSFPPTLQYGVYLPSATFWIELIGMLVIQIGVAAATGLFLYWTIIQPKRADTSFAFLIGFGVLLPYWVVWPMVLIRHLDIRNAMFKFAIGCITPTLCIFRTTECIFGFTPESVSKSALDYTFYYASILIFTRDKNGHLTPCPSSRVLTHLRNFLLFQIVTGVLQSVMTPYQYFAVFGGAEDWYAANRFFTWRLYANSALQASKSSLGWTV
jgi:hypothetical protein